MENIYQRLLKLRAAARGGIIKGGRNTFNKYNYFQLEDIYALVGPVCEELGLFSYYTFQFDAGRGVYHCALTFQIVEEPEEESPVEMVLSFHADLFHEAIKGQVAQQASGSTYSYGLRYLWQMVLQLTEQNSDPDAVNDGPATTGKKYGVKEQKADPDTLAAIENKGASRVGDEWNTKKPEIALWASNNRTNALTELTQSEAQRLLEAWES